MVDDQWLDKALAVAKEAGAAAADIIAYYRNHSFDIEYKADQSPVTVADKEAESAIRRIIMQSYPDHAIYGEEQGKQGDSDFLWLVDPLDGTKSFVRGTDFYSTQIGLMVKGTLVLGVSTAKHVGETLWARRGGGAFCNGQAIHVAPTDDVSRAVLSSGNIASLAKDTQAWRAYGNLLGKVNKIRGYGDFCHYHLLAQGKLDVVVESDVNILDIAALAVIVEEAGGVFTDLEGHSPGLDVKSVLASNQALHAPVLKQIAYPSMSKTATLDA